MPLSVKARIIRRIAGLGLGSNNNNSYQLCDTVAAWQHEVTTYSELAFLASLD
jgi:hypothetical protein